MKTLVKGIKYIAIVIAAAIGTVFIAGMIKGASDAIRNDKGDAIHQALSKHCDCEDVNQFIYAYGAQFSKSDGFSTEKAEYQLTNCTYDNLDQEAARINAILIEEVVDYKDLDLLKLEFVGPEKHETVTIKNGVIQ